MTKMAQSITLANNKCALWIAIHKITDNTNLDRTKKKKQSVRYNSLNLN